MRNDLVVEKMLQLIEKIQSYCEDVTYETFSANDMLVEACVFNLSQLGELSNRIDEKFEEEHPEIPWRELYGLRNRIVHDYEGVNLKLVWEIVESDLADLKQQLLTI
jgi:uncharacterized protein with HEPN domain